MFLFWLLLRSGGESPHAVIRPKGFYISTASAFLPIQHDFSRWSQVNVLSATPNMEDPSIFELTHKKQPGSLQWQKTWITWSNSMIKQIRQEMMRTILTEDDLDGSMIAMKELEQHLSLVGDRGKIQKETFSHPGARLGYTLSHMGRIRRLADLLIFSKTKNQLDNSKQKASFETTRTTQLISSFRDTLMGKHGQTCQILSIGGGPGYDYIAMCLLSLFLQRTLTNEKSQQHDTFQVRCVVFDYELGWKDLIERLEKSTNLILSHVGMRGNSCIFGGACDITQNLDETVNHNFRDQISTTDVFVCQYCIAENYTRLKDVHYCFFQDLLTRSSDGTLFLFTETTHRMWPDLVDYMETGFEVAFVKNRSLQLLVQKRTGSILSDDIRNQCLSIRHQIAKHRVKRDAGFTRQGKRFKSEVQN
jgi:hypothetical protein